MSDLALSSSDFFNAPAPQRHYRTTFANFLRLLVLTLLICLPQIAFAQMQFGANGHPNRTPNNEFPLEQEMDMLVDLGVKSYRVDIYSASQATIDRLWELVGAAEQRGIEILPVLHVDLESPTNASLTLPELKFKAKNIALPLANAFGAHIKVWEMGNEYDNYALIKPGETQDNGQQYPLTWGEPPGNRPWHFYTPRYERAKAVLEGFAEGLSGIAEVRRIIDITWIRYSFFERLRDDAVPYEITGSHWYSIMGNPEDVPLPDSTRFNFLQKLEDFGKPIWITEFNRHAGSEGTDGETLQAAEIEKMMYRYKTTAAQYGIEMAHVYELTDEPWVGPGERLYGIVKVTKPGTLYQFGDKKPAYYSFQRMASTTLPPKPDLIVSSFTPISATVGSQVLFTATVRNQGVAPTPGDTKVAVGFYKGGSPLALFWGSKTVTLKPGETVDVVMTSAPPNGSKYWIATAGSHSFTAWVDDQNQVDELSDANNKKTQTVTVQ